MIEGFFFYYSSILDVNTCFFLVFFNFTTISFFTFLLFAIDTNSVQFNKPRPSNNVARTMFLPMMCWSFTFLEDATLHFIRIFCAYDMVLTMWIMSSIGTKCFGLKHLIWLLQTWLEMSLGPLEEIQWVQAYKCCNLWLMWQLSCL